MKEIRVTTSINFSSNDIASTSPSKTLSSGNYLVDQDSSGLYHVYGKGGGNEATGLVVLTSEGYSTLTKNISESFVTSKNYIVEGIGIKKNTLISLKEKVHTYDFVSIDMTNILSMAQSEEFHNFQSSLPQELIYTEEKEDYGVERKHHITVFYGLPYNEYNFKLIKQYVNRHIKNVELEIKGISFFRLEDKPYDVMKLDINSEALNNIHYFIDDNFENENTFKDYHPHMTVAYIKKGAFTDLEGKSLSFCNDLIGCAEIEYQDIYGDKRVIPIG